MIEDLEGNLRHFCMNRMISWLISRSKSLINNKYKHIILKILKFHKCILKEIGWLHEIAPWSLVDTSLLRSISTYCEAKRYLKDRWEIISHIL